MADKIYSPKEAAMAVLAKAEELYKNSPLSKAEHKKSLKKDMPAPAPTATPTPSPLQAGMNSAFGFGKTEKPLEKKHVGFKAVEESARKSGASDPAAVAAAVGMKKYGKKAFEQHAHEGKKFKKSDEEGHNPDSSADAQLGEKVEQDVHQHEEKNADPAHQEPPMKGHIKLAKFMGRMEHKKEMKSKEMDKSQDPLNSIAGDRIKRGIGYKERGDMKSAQIANEGAKDSHKDRLQGIKEAPKPKIPG